MVNLSNSTKALTKKSDFDCKSMSSIGFGEGQKQTGCEQNNNNPKPLQMVDLGTKKEPLSSTDIGSKQTRPAGLEPATYGLEIRCSIRLSYGRFNS